MKRILHPVHYYTESSRIHCTFQNRFDKSNSQKVWRIRNWIWKAIISWVLYYILHNMNQIPPPPPFMYTICNNIPFFSWWFNPWLFGGKKWHLLILTKLTYVKDSRRSEHMSFYIFRESLKSEKLMLNWISALLLPLL